jgi:hypothetical protein
VATGEHGACKFSKEDSEKKMDRVAVKAAGILCAWETADYLARPLFMLQSEKNVELTLEKMIDNFKFKSFEI